MAGGMTPGRSGRSLAERAVRSGVGPAPVAPAPMTVPAPAAAEGEGRHCWVRDPPAAPGVWPGLLIEWRQRDGGWQGRVAYTVGGPHGSALVETWLPAAQLEPR